MAVEELISDFYFYPICYFVNNMFRGTDSVMQCLPLYNQENKTCAQFKKKNAEKNRVQD